MPQCIFCLESADALSEEHIFLAALGGVWTLKHGSHSTCNGGFSTAEKLVADELRTVRNLLQVPDRRGDIPFAQASFKIGDTEHEGRVLGDGTLQPKPIVKEIVTEAGAKEIHYKFPTPTMKAHFEKLAADGKAELIKPDGPEEPLVAEIGLGGEIKHLGATAGRLVAAKTAYVGLAEIAGAKLASSDAFKPIRSALIAGDARNFSRIFVNKNYLDAVQQGPHQHSLTVSACHATKRVDAIVRLFGQLSYFVRLSNTYEGADFFKTVVYDASRGEDNGTIVNLLDIELAQTEHVADGADTQWDDVAGWGKQFAEYLDAEIRKKTAASVNSPKSPSAQ